MKKFTSFILLLLITTLGFIVRFYRLGEAPAGLYLDEAAQGYNAYSILKTGRDEFGKFFPVVFRSFADFKTPIYIYLIVPLIPIFGLTPFTVRLPSFIFSVLTLPLVYFLIRRLLNRAKIATPLALLTVLLLAISPWHTLFARADFEANIALFFLLLAIYVFYSALKRPSLLILSAFFFVVAFSAYHAERIIVPLILLLLFIRHYRTLLATHQRPFLLAGLILGFLLSLPTLFVMATPGWAARATTLNIFTANPSGYLAWYHGPASTLVNASWYLWVKEFFALYFSYLSPRNLFFLGDSNPRTAYPDLAPFFTWQFPLYLFGLYRLVKDTSLRELRFLILALLLISPLPAAMTRDPFSTIRALPLVIPLTLIITLGLIRSYQSLKPAGQRTLIRIGFVGVIIYSLFNLGSSAFVLNEYFNAKNWDYGWRQVVEVLNRLDPKLPLVVDSARGEIYSEILFFSRFSPLQYQEKNFEVPLDEYYQNLQRNPIKTIGNITVRGIAWKPDLAKEQYLVGDHLAISVEQIENNHLTLIKEINYPDGTPAFRIVKTNPNPTSE